MKIHDFAQCFASAARHVAGQREYLCQLDTFIGDGDHGITAERGFLAAAAVASNEENTTHTAGQLFTAISAGMSRTMGGAIGPLYAAFWSGAAASCQDRTEINGTDLALCFAGGLAKLTRLGKTAEGEKTMVDAMAPCVRAMQAAADSGKEMGAMLQAGAAAANAGSQATRDMVAHKGRARFLGDKSAGYVDPGSASFAIFMQALAQEINAWEGLI